MSRNAGACSVLTCERSARAKGLCSAHYFRQRRTGDVQARIPVRAQRYREHLPAGYWSDVPIGGAGFFGAVIVCEACGDQLGPVWIESSAAMAIHAHQLRAHNDTGRHLDQ